MCRLAFQTMAELPNGSRRKGGPVSLIEELYMKNAYSMRRGRVAKAVLLGLEIGGSSAGGPQTHWAGEVQLEHLLPQVGWAGQL